jgi:tRNA (Thr-GGU) A37 N-methylase
VVTLLGRREKVLDVSDVDVVEGMPLLDIKPFVPGFDARDNCRTGWMEMNIHKLPTMKDDGRFVD